MHDLAEIMEKNKDVKEVKEKLLECFKSELSSKGAAGMDAEEAGEVVDMIKDLAETEKYCMEALYYQKVVEAMTTHEEPRYNEYERMGYAMSPRMDHYGSASYDRPMKAVDYSREMYSDNDIYSKRNGSSDNMMDGRYGQAYNEYKNKRRHYTTSKSQEDKREMDIHAQEHVQDSIATIRDIWKDADPELKKRMKEDFSKLVNEMTV